MQKRILDKFYKKLHTIQKSGATRNESVISDAFKSLLQAYCDTKNLILLREKTYKNTRIKPDGTVRGALPNIDYGHWESKDIYDDIDKEIEKKIEKGYPTDNIIFENSRTIVLIQKRNETEQGKEIMRCNMQNPKQLDKILRAFLSYQPKIITDFFESIERFKEDVPYIVKELRGMIMKQAETNKKFKSARDNFLELCKQSIDKTISIDDIREMLIQHILTDEIFSTIYNETYFHRENNVATELQKVVNTFFTREIRHNTLAKIDHYYKTIKSYAAQIEDYSQKQEFLKIVYENFYKAYNPKGADKLGIVFTPNEIVKFMIESTDYLIDYHFNKTLSDKNVEILDPATGTGTFISDLLRYINPQKLEYKYRNEIHVNEVAILPYYIANLNIEYTFQQITDKYLSFENIVFVDTLENYYALNWERKGIDEGFMQDIFSISKENLNRIKNQNKKKISVIIGNPPYNANQQNWNDFNKNKEYPQIDERIKNTYVKLSNATKTKVYDMFSRFFRWASDRISDDGIIAFITNRSFIDSHSFDGFRRSISKEFDYSYIVDLNGDIRTKGEKTSGNVFGIRTGVAVIFLIKKQEYDLNNRKIKKRPAKIYYTSIFKHGTAEQKLEYLVSTNFHYIPFERIIPDKDENWINLTNNDFDNLIKLTSKETKSGKKEDSVFKLFHWGNSSNRDEWVYDFDKKNLIKKNKYLIQVFNKNIKLINKKDSIGEIENKLNRTIKWSSNLQIKASKKRRIKFNKKQIITSLYRPYTKMYLYADTELNDRLTKNHYETFGRDLQQTNKIICITAHKQVDFIACASNILTDAGFGGRATHNIALYRYDENNNKYYNITNYGSARFKKYYKDETITKEDIFHYVYAVIHNPEYRKKYKQNLKREFPRTPFYDNFRKWVSWGKILMDLHINYESVEPYPSVKTLHALSLSQHKNPKPKLKRDKKTNEIFLDGNTNINGIPETAWEYKLGNRSALEWILNQYREKNYSKKAIETYPNKKTLHENFNNYKFTDYKNYVIDLIKRVTTVSVKTMEIIKQMEKEKP